MDEIWFPGAQADTKCRDGESGAWLMLNELKKSKEILIGGTVLSAIFCGVVFAFKDFGHVSPILSFIGGLITGPLFVFFTFGFIIFSVYTSVAIQSRFGLDDGGKSENRMSALLFAGFVLTAVWMVPLFWATTKIPVIGDQVGFMFRDR